MIIPLCQWGNSSHETCVAEIVEPAADYSTPGALYLEHWNNIRLFPALLLFYVGGIAAVAAENYGMFAALVKRAKFHDLEGEHPLCSALSHPAVFGQALRAADTQYNRFIGSSVYLSQLLRPLFSQSIPQQYRFEATFDRFEYLFAMAQADLYEKLQTKKGFGVFSRNSAGLSLETEAGPMTSSPWSNRKSKNSGTTGHP